MHLSDLPEGTVTFLFTDIEGSTQLLSQLRDRYAILLADQRLIQREAFSRWGGQEVDTQGDAFFVAFPRATQAVCAAVAIQRVLVAHHWPSGVDVRVRMGLHTGEPLKAEEGYLGMDVHRAARIAHVGHGGQVLLSETTASLVKGDLPSGVSLLDLGRHRLKDMPNPEHIRQLVIDGLPSEFPPLKSLEMLSPAISLDAGSVRLPAFLEEGTIDPPAPLFVGRERELARLDSFLDQALAGEGGVAFITGGPGEGKTALMEAFVRRGLAAHPDLIVASGRCHAYTGVGDPYLPFRDVLGDLTGDVETKWVAGSISSNHAKRLWEVMPITAQALVDQAPDLVGVFISGKDLLSRISIAIPEQRSLLQSLRALAQRERATPVELEQKGLFEQYLNILCELSSIYPLLILLDDLQWADYASLNLLFHLGRELSGGRILLLGAYRPEEVASGKGGERHPLEEILAELKRLYGDVWINLSERVPDEGRAFVTRFLDSEPNRLSQSFREALFTHTEGHPLFTIELLREMQTRGDLVRDQAGYWSEGEMLNWQQLPARVEGVIEARIGRLEDELRDILTIASVEGEDFTAQVVARVQELSERKLLHQLSVELERRHRLIHAQGETCVGDHTLSQYRFTHTLFQQFIYNGLTPGERRLLHREIAAILEELYAEDTEAVSLQLAHHYSAANEGEKAVPYLLQAGDQARNLYAHQEAISYYRRALDFQLGLGDYGGAARTQMKLGQTYHSAFDYRQANEAYQASFRLWGRASESRSVAPPALSSQALKFILRWDPFTLDPGLVDDLDTSIVIGHIFSGLLEPTPQMDVVPDLAHSWEILEGGCRYIFHLRQEARWSDGVSLTAHDFVYAWRRLLNPAKPQLRMAELLYDVKGARAFHLGVVPRVESLGVRAIDPYTLEVELEAPAGYFLQLMANPVAYPVPRHVVERCGAAWTDLANLVVNGPFRIQSWQPGESLTLVRNSEYAGHFSGNLGRVEFTFTLPSEWSTQVSMFESSELDILQLTYFPPAEITRLRRQYLAEDLSMPLQDIFFFEFNTTRAPFDDPRVRRAFMLAFDREALSPTTGGAVIPIMGGLIPPGIPGHSPEIGLPYDLDGARELLAQAGYPGGRNFPIVEILLWPGAEVYLESTMLSLREVLGVEHTWDFVPIIEIPERAKVKPPHITLMGWIADYPDPDNYLRVGFHKQLTGWHGGAFEELIELARRTQDQGERIRLYQRADKMLIDEAIVLPFANCVGHFLVKPWVKNFPLSPMGIWFLKDVVIEPH